MGLRWNHSGKALGTVPGSQNQLSGLSIAPKVWARYGKKDGTDKGKHSWWSMLLIQGPDGVPGGGNQGGLPGGGDLGEGAALEQVKM